MGIGLCLDNDRQDGYGPRWVWAYTYIMTDRMGMVPEGYGPMPIPNQFQLSSSIHGYSSSVGKRSTKSLQFQHLEKILNVFIM